MRRKRKTDPSIPGCPSYRLHRRSGQAVVTLSGQDIYLGRYGAAESHDRYRNAVAEWAARGRRPDNPAPEPITVAEICLEYLRWAERYYIGPDGRPREKELWHIKRTIRELREAFGLTPAAEFGPRKLEVIRDRFVAGGFCRSQCNRRVQAVRRIFKWATAKELLPPSVWHGLDAVEGLRRGHTTAPETAPVRPVADDLVDAVRPYVSRPVWAMIELQRLTGMRPGETVILRGVDVDRSGTAWTYVPEHHKTEHHGRQRVIVLGPRAQDILRPFLRPGYCFSPREADRERRDALPCTRPAKRL